jgi:lysophospholipase L1-like esterase
MRNLIKMYESARGEGILPVPVTVPSILVDVDHGGPDAEAYLDRHLTLRESLNASIGDYARSKGLPCIDLFAATADSATRQLAWRYSNDGVHLTTAGYRLFAKLLVDQVFTPRLSKGSGGPI